MRTASVGFQCPECSRAATSRTYTARELRARAAPVVTQALVAANVVIFVLTLVGGGNLSRAGGDPIVDYGLVGLALGREGLVGVDAGEWYRLVTGGFLHSGLLHLGFNMYLLWLLGSQLEPALGRIRFGVLYATSLLAGSFGVLLVDPTALTVGASGAVFGLMGAMVVAQRAVGIDPWRSGIGSLVVLNVIITFAIPNISIGGHIGGLVGGLAAGWLLIELPRLLSTGDGRTREAIGAAATAALGVASVGGALWAAGTWANPVFG